MRKSIVLVLILAMISCEGKKEIQLAKANKSMVTDIQDHSPVYIFFKKNGKDTIADVNRKNTISSTNWIFNIDKRLPLKLVIPELIKLQEKKEKSVHKSENSGNYFSYANDSLKALSFLSFSDVNYKLAKPENGIAVYFTKDKITINNLFVDKVSLPIYLNSLPSDKPNKYIFCFDKNLSFDDYVKSKIYLSNLVFKSELIIASDEFIY